MCFWVKSTCKNPASFADGDMGDSSWPDGRYVKVGVSSDTVALISDGSFQSRAQAGKWINKDFFASRRFAPSRSPACHHESGDVRDSENADWKLRMRIAGEQVDVSESSSAANALGTPSFVDVHDMPSQNSLFGQTYCDLARHV